MKYKLKNNYFMEQLSKLKLNVIRKVELDNREMHQLLGGVDFGDGLGCCGCGCQGSSSTGKTLMQIQKSY
jgi:natural product precursor